MAGKGKGEAYGIYDRNARNDSCIVPLPPYCGDTAREKQEARNAVIPREAFPIPFLQLFSGQTFADGEFGKFGDTMYIELIHNVFSVRLYGFFAQIEGKGNFFGILPLGNELKNLPFSR